MDRTTEIGCRAPVSDDAGYAPGQKCSRRDLILDLADRYKDKIAGWWFEGMGLNTYEAQPNDWWTIESIVHAANPRAIIAFSYGANEQACVCKGIDDYTGGDTWSKQDLKRLTPQRLPPQEGISCGMARFIMATSTMARATPTSSPMKS